LPTKYDGQANVYYGVATRTRKEGTGAAAGSVGVIYCDEITKSAPDIPPFSYMVETSAGKVQAYYLLDVPATDLRCAELLSQRLGQAVGGDTVWDRARILRVPGFLNVKFEHPEQPRAYLLERNPDLRYSLEELESVLPALPAGDQDLPLREYTGPFDPHVGTPLAQTDQDRLAAFLKDLGYGAIRTAATPAPARSLTRMDPAPASVISIAAPLPAAGNVSGVFTSGTAPARLTRCG